ncbi:FAD/NAD(P)-binding domain-containing protein [Neofusicoccum parvum]|uniref:FAD/NAD(P)-binding domain-containing protein n=1 Tax=Neofusicoccum parvum TaxID=310453 RepID=A0ACB5S2U8_9PEZI|nr:FAD/NAD(P)-binding domain-containing protein [Neofusicoccum parvum]
MPALNVAIIGAGPAGCTLARLLLLRQHSRQADDSSPVTAQLRVQVFEAEPAPGTRRQGGTLDLHPSTGLAALQQAALYDEFLARARFDGEAFRLCDKQLASYVRVSGPPQHRQQHRAPPAGSRGAPEIDRAALRSMLVQALPDGTVRWGWRLQTVSEQLSTQQPGVLEPFPPSYSLHFDGNRTLSGFDLVVSADGAWSRVRPLLAPFSTGGGAGMANPAGPVYSGIAGFRCSIPDAARTAPAVFELVNRGSLFAFSDSKTLMGQQLGDGSIWVSASGVKAEDWVDEQRERERLHRRPTPPPQEPAAAAGDGKEQQHHHHRLPQDRNHVGAWFKDAVRAEYKGWAPELLQLVDAAEDSARLLPIYMLPPGFRWRTRPGLTLIGDAAHLIVPFAGEGVNIALKDALELSRAIIAALSSGGPADDIDGRGDQQRVVDAAAEELRSKRKALAAKVAEYEHDMFSRAHAVQSVSVGMMRAMFFTPGAPRSSIEAYVCWKAWQMQPLLYPLVFVVTHIYFAVWKLFN